MGIVSPQRAVYRVRQFLWAITWHLRPLTASELAPVNTSLPDMGQRLFTAMSRADQRHSLNVYYALRQAGHEQRALLQAALLHDCAKHEAGIRLWHRVAMVLLKAFAPAVIARWSVGSLQQPERRSWYYALWAHLNHPQRGAELAAEAGCEPLAVELIRRHQEPAKSDADTPFAHLLAALQAADDDN